MPKPKLRRPREAARILGISFATVKQWIYKGKLRTVKTLGGHHRILEEDVERHLRSKLADERRKKCRFGPDKISESNQLLGRTLQIKVDGVIAQITILAGEYELTSLITTDAVSELELRTGDDVIALLKSSQIMILREPV
jgi:molybdopterin-binding protein